jgi:predicted hydrolase (HD superfamily)
MGGLTREQAWTLLNEYNKDPFHIKHALIMEGTMRYFAKLLGYGEEEDFWGIVGLLHDLDFGMYPEQPLCQTAGNHEGTRD